MSVRNDIIEYLVTEFKDIEKFKRVYKNNIPIWSDVKQFPSIAVLYEEEEKEPDNITNSKAYFKGKLVVFVYNKQKLNEHNDILSDLIDEVYKILQKARWSNNAIIDLTPSNMKNDGGVLHPYSVANIVTDIRFIQRI